MNNLNLGLLILRLSLGILMLLHGIAKITNGVGSIENMLEKAGLPAFFAYGTYLGEILAPVLLIIGFRTRIASFLFICTMLVAIFIANPHKVTMLLNTGGWAVELQALFLFGALTLFFTGGGKLSVSTRNKWD